MRRRITLLITCLSVALVAAISPLALFAEPTPPPESYTEPAGLRTPPGLARASSVVSVMLELDEAALPPTSDPARSQRVAAAQQQLLVQLAGLGAQVMFQTRLVLPGVAVTIPADRLSALEALPGVKARVIPPKSSAAPAALEPDAPAIAGAIAGATGAGVRVGLIDRGIDYTHADFGGPGTAAAYTANNPTLIEPGSFPTTKVSGGYDFAGDAYDASNSASATPSPDADPLECKAAPGLSAQPLYMGQGTHAAGMLAGFGVTTSGATYYGPYTPAPDPQLMSVSPGIAPEAQLYALKVFGCSGTTTLLMAALERALDPNGDGNPADHLDVAVIMLGTPFGSPDDPDALAIDNAVRAGMVVVVAAGDTLNTFYAVNSPASARLAIAAGATDNGAGALATSSRGPAVGNAVLKPDIVAPGAAISSAAVGSGTGAVAMSGTVVAAAQVGGAAALLRQMHADWAPTQIKAALLSSATPGNLPPSLAGAGRLNLSGLGTLSMLASGSDGGGLVYGAPWAAAGASATRTLTLENMSASDQLVTLSATAVATETGVTVQVPSGQLRVPAHGSAQATIGLAIDPQRLDFSPDPATATQQNGRARHYLAEQSGYIQVIGDRGVNGVRVRPAHGAHFDSVDFYLDDTLLDGSIDSREVQDYITATAGLHLVKIRRVGSSPNSRPIFSAPVELQDGHDYTLILVGRPGALGEVTVDETVASPPPAGQSLIHYVNANRTEPTWNIGPLDVYLDGVLQVAALAVGQTSGYTPIAPGTHTVAFYQAGANPAGPAHTRKTFTIGAGEAVLAGTGRHNDNDNNLNDFEQRAFVGHSALRIGNALLASVPYAVFPTVAASSHADSTLLVAPGAGAFTLALHNSGARNTGLVSTPGAPGTPKTPLASAFELAAVSPAMPTLDPTLRPADVQYVGVTNSYSITHNLDQFTYIYFGLSAYAPWSTPNQVEYQVWIDSNHDGRDDYVLVNGNHGELTGGAASDVFINVLYPLKADGVTPIATDQFIFWGSFAAPIQSSIDLAPFNSAVLFLRAKASDLALPLDPARPTGPKGPTPSSFCYHVETRARALSNFQQQIDRVPDATAAPQAECGGRAGVLLYDITNPAIAPINTSNFIFSAPIAPRPIFLDTDGGAITGLARSDVLAARGGAKLLILHHHNAPYPQAELVDVRPLALGSP